MGAMLVSDRIAEPFMQPGQMFAHGYTWGGHPVSAAVALANLDIIEGEGLLDNVRDNEDAFFDTLDTLLDLPIVGNVRGAGYFYGIELVRDKATRETLTPEECERVLYGYLSKALWDAGCIAARTTAATRWCSSRRRSSLGRRSSTRSKASCGRC